MTRRFEESVVCRAPAVEVWKLLHDPRRFEEWWVGVTRVEPTPDGAAVYTDAYPHPVPTRVTAAPEGGRVVVNCLMTEDVLIWSLEPHPEGCRVTLNVEVADGDAGRVAVRHRVAVASLARLAEAAAREKPNAQHAR